MHEVTGTGSVLGPSGITAPKLAICSSWCGESEQICTMNTHSNFTVSRFWNWEYEMIAILDQGVSRVFTKLTFCKKRCKTDTLGGCERVRACTHKHTHTHSWNDKQEAW